MSIAVIKYHGQDGKEAGEERICLTCMFQSVTRGSQGRSSRLEAGGMNPSGDHGGTLITGLLLVVCSVCFLMHSRTTWTGMALPTVGWPSHINVNQANA